MLAITLIGVIVLSLGTAMVVYTPRIRLSNGGLAGLGLVRLAEIPASPLTASPTAYHFKEAHDPRVEGLFA